MYKNPEAPGKALNELFPGIESWPEFPHCGPSITNYSGDREDEVHHCCLKFSGVFWPCKLFGMMTCGNIWWPALICKITEKSRVRFIGILCGSHCFLCLKMAVRFKGDIG